MSIEKTVVNGSVQLPAVPTNVFKRIELRTGKVVDGSVEFCGWVGFVAQPIADEWIANGDAVAVEEAPVVSEPAAEAMPEEPAPSRKKK